MHNIYITNYFNDFFAFDNSGISSDTRGCPRSLGTQGFSLSIYVKMWFVESSCTRTILLWWTCNGWDL